MASLESRLQSVAGLLERTARPRRLAAAQAAAGQRRRDNGMTAEQLQRALQQPERRARRHRPHDVRRHDRQDRRRLRRPARLAPPSAGSSRLSPFVGAIVGFVLAHGQHLQEAAVRRARARLRGPRGPLRRWHLVASSSSRGPASSPRPSSARSACSRSPWLLFRAARCAPRQAATKIFLSRWSATPSSRWSTSACMLPSAPPRTTVRPQQHRASSASRSASSSASSSCCMAAYSLVLDFTQIKTGVERGAPRIYGWRPRSAWSSRSCLAVHRDPAHARDPARQQLASTARRSGARPIEGRAPLPRCRVAPQTREVIALLGPRRMSSRIGGELQPGHSHSMVPGGFDVTSSTTRLTPATSLVMRFEMRASTS